MRVWIFFTMVIMQKQSLLLIRQLPSTKITLKYGAAAGLRKVLFVGGQMQSPRSTRLRRGDCPQGR